MNPVTPIPAAGSTSAAGFGAGAVSSASQPSLLMLYYTYGKNYRNERGDTLLHMAIEMEDEDGIDMLLAEGLDPLAENNKKHTPLYLAAQKNLSKIVEKLTAIVHMSGRAIENPATPLCLTPLFIAVIKNNAESVDAIVKGGSRILQERVQRLILISVAFAMHAQRVSDLFIETMGALIDEEDEEGNTMLHLAVKHGDLAAAEKLLTKGVRLVKNREGYNPMELAAMNGNTPMLQLFARHRYRLDEAALSGKTPLYLAAENGHDEACEFLLIYLQSQGIDITPGVAGHPSPLELMIRKNLSKSAAVLIPALIRQGVDLTTKNSEGKTPLLLALESNALPVAGILIEQVALEEDSLLETLQWIVFLDNPELLLALERKKPGILTHVYNELTTVYILAITYSSTRILSILRPDPSAPLTAGDISELILESKMFAHLTGLTGTITFEEQTFDLEGFLPNLAYRPAEAAITDGFLSHMKEEFAAAANAHRSDEELAGSITAGKLTVIPSGWLRHAVSIVIQGEIMIVCNRGETPIGTPPMKAFVIDPAKMTPDLVRRLRLYSTKAEMQKFIYEDLPALLAYEGASASLALSKRENIQTLLDTVQPKNQKTGNCSTAAVKAAIRAALFLDMYQKHPQTAASLMGRVKEVAKSITKTMRDQARERCLELIAREPKYSGPILWLIGRSDEKTREKLARSAVATASAHT